MPLSISRPPFDWLGLESSSSRGGVRKRKWAINRQLKLEVVTPVVSWVPCILSHSCLSLVKSPAPTVCLSSQRQKSGTKQKLLCFGLLFMLFARGREKERKRNINVWEKPWLVAPHTPLSRDLARNPGTCPDWAWNQRPFGLQGGTQSTEPHQARLSFNINNDNYPQSIF